MYDQKQAEVVDVYNNITGETRTELTDTTSHFLHNPNYGYIINPDKLKEIEDRESVIFQKHKLHETQKSENIVCEDLHKSKYFKGLVKTVIHEISTLENASDYISEQCPIQCLCKLHMRDQIVRKSLLTYESFIDMRKHMYNYILNKMISQLLKAPEDKKGNDFNEFLIDYQRYNADLKVRTDIDFKKYGKLFSINKIMRRNFEIYIDYYMELKPPDSLI